MATFRMPTCNNVLAHGTFLRNIGCASAVSKTARDKRNRKGIQACRASGGPQVVLTREKGKNGELGSMLDRKQIRWLEMPLIESTQGADRAILADAIREQKHEWTVITSPESASVFLGGWREAGKPKVKIASVGEGTSRILEAVNEPELLQIAFTPTKANADHLSAEIPLESESGTTVLYPASEKARQTLQKGLEGRGCLVTRLNTYNTVPVSGLDAGAREAAKAAGVVAIASPSAVNAWVELVGSQAEADVAFACIGSTSARAAEKLGLKRIFTTESPGLEGFLEAIEEALEASPQLA